MLCGNADQEFEEPSPAIFLVTIQVLEEDGLRPWQQILKEKLYDEVLKRTNWGAIQNPICSLSGHSQLCRAFHHGQDFLF